MTTAFSDPFLESTSYATMEMVNVSKRKFDNNSAGSGQWDDNDPLRQLPRVRIPGGATVSKLNPEWDRDNPGNGEKFISLPNNRVYYFFSNPDLKPTDSNLVNGRKTWGRCDVVEIAPWCEIQGVDSSKWNTKWQLRRIPVKSVTTLSEDGKKLLADYSNSDPLIKFLINPKDSKPGQPPVKGRPSKWYPAAAVELEKAWIAPNASAAQREEFEADGGANNKAEWRYSDVILGFKPREYEQFINAIQLITDMKGEEFNIAGQPLRIWKDDNGVLQVRIDKDAPVIEDMTAEYDPISLSDYLLDVRRLAEAELKKYGVDLSPDTPVAGSDELADAVATVASAGMIADPLPPTNTDKTSVLEELRPLTNDQLRAKAEEVGFQIKRWNRQKVIEGIADAMS